MTRSKWKLKDYGSGWSANEISDDLNKLSSEGWEMYKTLSIPESYEISRFPDKVPGLNDGDSVGMKFTLRVMLRR